jgi:hypothetical protein
MTTLVSWLGVDSRGPSSIYIASDSRLSWDSSNGSPLFWDSGRKVFASHSRPEIAAYSGDVVFPSLVLGQLIEQSENDSRPFNAQARWTEIVDFLRDSFASYPLEHRRGFSVIYCARTGALMKAVFSAFVLDWTPDTGWNSLEVARPSESDVLVVRGSGSTAHNKWHARWQRAQPTRTSRAVFSAFCDSVAAGDDQYSGGAPQLAGIYRKDRSARNIGVIFQGKRFLAGAPDRTATLAVEWRNHVFECCDPVTLEKLPRAARHLVPRGLGGQLRS